MIKCKSCSITSKELAPCLQKIEFLKAKDICPDCYIKSKGLIKQGNHYVPWDYQNFCDVEKDTPIKGGYEDRFAVSPKISWCDRYKKWKLEFQGADSGGYDVKDFVWYFDKKKDIFS